MSQITEALTRRNAALETAAKAMSRNCYYRRSGFCLADCQGLIICDTTGLHILPWYEVGGKLMAQRMQEVQDAR